jgi:hypothetical protein
MYKSTLTHLAARYCHHYSLFRLFIAAHNQNVEAITEGTPQFFSHHTDSFQRKEIHTFFIIDEKPIKCVLLFKKDFDRLAFS